MAQNGHISIGRLGENIVAEYLRCRGFSIICRNYKKKWGELDIIAQKDGVLHFVEVKAGSWHGEEWPKEGADVHRPEDHMHVRKRERMMRAMGTYLAENRLGPDQSYTADLATVLINKGTRRARVRWVHDVVL